jgi:hypothetical protein
LTRTGSNPPFCDYSEGCRREGICVVCSSGYLDLPAILNCNYCAFADDLQIYISGPHSSIPDIVTLLSANLCKILMWCNSNGLVLNPSKTRAIIFQPQSPSDSLPKITINNSDIPYTESLEILGVSLKHDLTWDLQVSKVCKRIYYITHNFFRFKQYLTVDLTTRVY